METSRLYFQNCFQSDFGKLVNIKFVGTLKSIGGFDYIANNFRNGQNFQNDSKSKFQK